MGVVPRSKPHGWFLALSLLSAAVGFSAAPSVWLVPPLDGVLSGILEPLLVPGAPEVRWEVKIDTSPAGRRNVRFRVEGQGLSAEGGARLDGRGDGEWSLESATIDLGDWSGPILGKFAPTLTGSAAGQLRVNAVGTIRDRVPEGIFEVTLSGGSYDEFARKLFIAGLALRLRARLSDLRELRTEPGQVLSWERGGYDLLSLGAGHVEFHTGGGALHLEQARIGVLGGELEVARASVAFNAASFSVAARMSGVQLGELIPLLPPLFSSARGRLDGRVELRSDPEGLRIESARLALRGGETAELRFLPTPGIISSQLPALVRQYYPGLVQLETGGVPLLAEQLEVSLDAAGDEEGRTALVSITGGPADPALRAPVVLEVNVRGPLDQVVAFGTHSRLRFGAGK